MSRIKLPSVLQVVGVAVFGITIWKGVHGFAPSAGLILGAGMAYAGAHFSSMFK
jgi:type IV secretory pathway VirB2 component (pilin)